MVFFVIFMLLYMVFHSVTEALVLIFPTIYAMTGGLLLQSIRHYNFGVAVRRATSRSLMYTFDDFFQADGREGLGHEVCPSEFMLPTCGPFKLHYQITNPRWP